MGKPTGRAEKKGRSAGCRLKVPLRAPAVCAWAACCVAVLLTGGCGGVEGEQAVARWRAKRMDLDIVVEKGGSIEAAENREIRSEVEGQNRIIYLAPEGTQVKKGDVLVRLDSSQLEERLTQQEIAYQTALANKVQAEEQYEIQVSQNESDVAQAELTLEFAIMDLRKYTGYEGPIFRGEALAEQVDPPAPGGGSGPASGGETAGSALAAEALEAVAFASPQRIHPDLEALLKQPLRSYTSGEAAQLWRKAESAVKLAEAELARASGEYEGSQELYKKNFIAKTQLEADQISYERAKVDVQEARESLRLLEEFTHPRNLKQSISDVREAYLELERVKRKARAQLSRVKADLQSKVSTYEHQKKLLERLQDQVAKCTIRAPGPGLVVYARPRRWGLDMIEEGSMVHERQEIIYLPDLSRLVVNVQIHESRISQIREGQPAEISVDAVRGATFRGRVMKVGVLPDHVNRWLNPDLKVYKVLVSIDDTKNVTLKPGMSANVKILVERRRDVLCVPRQAVTPVGDEHFVQRASGGDIVKQKVQIGRYNDFFVEISDGLKEGDEVLLAPLPTEVGKGEGKKEEKNEAREERRRLESPPGAGAAIPPAKAFSARRGRTGAMPPRKRPGAGKGSRSQSKRRVSPSGGTP